MLILLPAGRMAHAAGSLCNTPTASGCAGATALPIFNPTHYALQVGTTITSKIIGATDLLGTETCTGGGAGVDVIIKSTPLGNTTICGSLSGCPGTGCTITFTYTAPANGCQTEIVAYKTNGNNADNDIIDDGIKNGSATSTAGFGFVDGSGNPINTCGGTTTTSSTTSTTSSTSSSSSTTSSTSSTSSSTSSTTTSTTSSTSSSSSTSTSSSTTTSTTSSTSSTSSISTSTTSSTSSTETTSTTSSSSSSTSTSTSSVTTTSTSSSTSSTASTSTSTTSSTSSSKTTSTTSSSSTTSTETTTSSTETSTSSTSSSSSSTETTTSSTTTTTVCVPQPEICDNMIDDDCDGLIDCADPDCPPCPPIRSDPTQVKLGASDLGLDLVTARGHVRALSSVDPSSVRVGWLISTPGRIVYEGVLEPGDLTPLTRNLWVFEDPGAPLGQGTRDGIYKAKLIVGANTIWYRLQAYGDMAAAGVGQLAVQFYVGDQVYIVSGLWRPTPAGWIFHGHHGAGFDR